MPNLPIETWFFISFIIVGMIIAHLRFTENTVHEAPGILITIGIFATFYGIASGLYRFDMHDVETSLPQLILGIKLAFWASVIGVGAALTLKVRYIFLGSTGGASEQTEGATIDDLVVHMKNSAVSLDRIQQAMVGGEDSTLLTQLKLIRSDQNDKLEALRRAFSDFAEKQAENNSKALIEALKEVIKDFNEKIHEQFGENFKHLNQAIGKINQWQEQYKDQVSEMIAHQKQTASDMTEAGNSFAKILENSKSFSKVSESLQDTIGTMSALEQSLHSNLKSLAILIQSASTGIPTLENKVMEIITQVGNGAKASSEMISSQVKQSAFELTNAITKQMEVIGRNIEDMNVVIKQHTASMSIQVTQSAKQMGDAVQQQNESIGRGVESINKVIEQHTASMSTQVTQSAKQMGDAVQQQNTATHKSILDSSIQMQQSVSNISSELSKVIQKHNELIGKNLSELSKNTEQQVLALDAELASALKKSLDTLGQQLGALSTKFVSDYGPLTERLQKVVELSKNIKI